MKPGTRATRTPESAASSAATERITRAHVRVSNDAANRHLARVVIVPLTSNVEHLYPGEAMISVAGEGSKAMADQIMAADKTRFTRQLGTLTKQDLEAVEDAIRVQLGMPR